VSMFEPNAYKLEQEFGWLEKEQREELGRRTQEALHSTFVTFIEDMYNGEL